MSVCKKRTFQNPTCYIEAFMLEVAAAVAVVVAAAANNTSFAVVTGVGGLNCHLLTHIHK